LISGEILYNDLNRRKGVKSEELFEQAKKYIPGGVNSPVRAFQSVGGSPRFIARARGATIWDIDGRAYIDFVCSWGPLILGHAHAETMQALTEAMEDGWSYGAPTEIEVHLAELICRSVPSIESVRMVNSGTEAAMSALRLARAYTKRDLVIKFSGCYHGHADSFLAEAGSGMATLGIPASPGVTQGTIRDTLICPYNDIDAARQTCEKYTEQIAAIIVEPAAANMGVIPPRPGFLEGLRKLTEEIGALLIFDEVITGFRLSLGGAQSYFDVKPDLTTLGKIIGGGFPVGAYGGRTDIMQLVAPSGPVYQAGTLSGNPVAMTAGYVTLSFLADPRVYDEIEQKSAYFENGIRSVLSDLPEQLTLNRLGSMMTLFFTHANVVDFATAKTSNIKLYAQYFKEMLERNIYLAPSQFEACFISLAHTKENLDRAIEASSDALKIIFT
jgi:glutamate-1-semialdehyde 2,1-aminomutase